MNKSDRHFFFQIKAVLFTINIKQHDLLFTMILKINEHKFSILKRFLKNHVTLKNGAMATENSALQSQK